MRVSVIHRQDESFFGRKKESVTVTINVEFTEEEKAIVKHRKLDNDRIIFPPGDRATTIGSLMRMGFVSAQAPNVVQAKDLEKEILEQLKFLKEHIAGSAELGERRQIEL